MWGKKPPKPEKASVAELLDAMEQVEEGVSFATGVKQQFIAQGWDSVNAERMCIALVENATAAYKAGGQ